MIRHVAGFLLVIATITTSGHSTARDRDLTESADFRVRVAAALRLGRAGGAASRADLESGLRDAHPAVRVACAVSLGTLGDRGSIPALERAMRAESMPSAKSSMAETIAKLRGSGGSAAVDPRVGVEKAKYVVQLGAMRNTTGVRADIDTVMRSAARAKAGTIKNTVVLDSPDAVVLRRAGERRIPVLLVDGSLTKLSQSTNREGGVVVSARVDFSIRRVPQQTLKGMVSGNASAIDESRNAVKAIPQLQNRAVHSAVESAMSSVGSEIAALAN